MDIVRECAAHGHALKGLEVYDVGTGPFVDFVREELLDSFVSRGGSAVRFIQGSSGSGKTHALKLIEGMALRNGYATALINLSTGNNLRDWMAVTKAILTGLRIERDGEEHVGIDEMLRHFSRSGGGEMMFDRSVRHPCYRRAMQHVLSGDYPDNSPGGELLDQYLKGEHVMVSQFRERGITMVKRPLDPRNAEGVLSTALNCLPHIADPGHDPPKGTVLLFDEADNTWEGVGREMEETANYLRRLIDSFKTGEVRNTLAVFGVLPAFFDGCLNYQALVQRLEPPAALRGTRISWRRNVLSVADISSLSSSGRTAAGAREQFVRDLADRCVEMIERCGGDPAGAGEELVEAGMESLRATAGEDFRRQTIRSMMECTKSRISEGDG